MAADGSATVCGEFAIERQGVRKGIWLAVAIALCASIAVLLFSLPKPITDQHGFRQTQTALSVYWMLHGAPLLDYQTPVLGYPWSIPFEFPLYQWIVAGLVRISGIPVDPVGRIVSYAWLLLSLPPARILFRSYGFRYPAFPLYAALLLASPLYLFWGRAFLMETQALSLSIWMLALIRRFTERPHLGTMFACAIIASAAGLTKLTTLPPFILLSGLAILQALYRNQGNRWQAMVILGGSAVIFIPALILTAVWTHHADALKGANLLAKSLQSDAPMMMQWNFGSLEQRLSLDLAHAVLRTIIDVTGFAGLVLPLLIGVLLSRNGPGIREARVALLMIAAFLLPFEIFTNLHIVHNYYQSANGVFLIAALALTLTGFGARFGQRVMMLLTAAMIYSQFIGFLTGFLPSMLHPAQKEIAIADYIRGHTPPNSAILIVGLDWSPIVPYYAQRRALMIPDWKDKSVRERLDTTDEGLGSLEEGAVIICPSAISADPFVARLLHMQIGDRVRVRVEGCDVYA